MNANNSFSLWLRVCGRLICLASPAFAPGLCQFYVNYRKLMNRMAGLYKPTLNSSPLLPRTACR
jgi:hypothetical protein